MDWRYRHGSAVNNVGGSRLDPVEAYNGFVGHIRSARDAGDYLLAEKLARDGIAAVEVTLGPNAVELAVLLNELGVVGKYRGNFVEAEQLYRRALAIHESGGIAASANVAAILHNLAGVAHARGDARSAEPIARRGVAIREALADADPSALAGDRAALAAILIDAGKLSEARALLDDVLRDYEQRYGPVDHEVGVALHNLGSLQYRDGDVAAAETTLRRAAVIKRAVLGPQNPDLAITFYNLACCAQSLGNIDEAITHLRHAIEVLEVVVSETQPTLVACRRKLEQLLHGR
jgi:tetratricopeptide (TPR) repeat protein